MNGRDEHLLIALSAAVPLHILELRDSTPQQRQHIARMASAVIASQGDILQFRGHKRGETAKVFNHLARGLAAAAYQIGGVTFADHHWCTDHAVCTGDKPEPPQPSRPAPRTIVDLELPV